MDSSYRRKNNAGEKIDLDTDGTNRKRPYPLPIYSWGGFKLFACTITVGISLLLAMCLIVLLVCWTFGPFVQESENKGKNTNDFLNHEGETNSSKNNIRQTKSEHQYDDIKQIVVSHIKQNVDNRSTGNDKSSKGHESSVSTKKMNSLTI